MEVAQEDEKNEESSEAGAMVTFAWRPSSCLADGEVVTLVQLAGVFTKWEPVNMTPPPSSLKSRSLSVSSTSSDCAVSEDMDNDRFFEEEGGGVMFTGSHFVNTPAS